jgi:hypothetical protein
MDPDGTAGQPPPGQGIARRSSCASQLARQLALNNNVDLLVTSSTPETVNPVAVVAKP